MAWTGGSGAGAAAPDPDARVAASPLVPDRDKGRAVRLARVGVRNRDLDLGRVEGVRLLTDRLLRRALGPAAQGCGGHSSRVEGHPDLDLDRVASARVRRGWPRTEHPPAAR